MKNVLMLAYHFPPVGGLGAAGSQRVLKFARHLPDRNWRPTVLTVHESDYDAYLTLDLALSRQVPESIKVVRTGVVRILRPILNLKKGLSAPFRRPDSHDFSQGAAPPDPGARDTSSRYQRFKDAITDLFEIPDEIAGWFLPAVIRGFRTVRSERIDVIFATGRPWTTLVIGAALKLITRRPLVADFRDPWMTNPFRLQYSGLKNKLEGWLESFVVRSADVIIANTDYLREEFVERFGDSVRARCVTIINGFDAAEFANVVPGRPKGYENACVMTHSGFLYGKRDPRFLLEAIKLLRDSGGIADGEFLCNLVGQTELPYDLAEYLKTNALTDLVRLTGHVSYEESLAQLAGSDVALLLQPGTATQIPSKLFEYIGLGRRILTIAPPHSAVADMVRDNGLGPIAAPENVEDIARILGDTISDWRRGSDRLAIAPDMQARFDVRHCTERLANELDRLA